MPSENAIGEPKFCTGAYYQAGARQYLPEHSSIACDHANEVPMDCRCDPRCFCRIEGSCKNRSGPFVVPDLPPYRIVELYAVIPEIDENDEGEATAYFTDKYVAENYSGERGICGGPAAVRKRPVIKVGNEWFALESVNPLDVDLKAKTVRREEALAKLTKADKDILGITD